MVEAYHAVWGCCGFWLPNDPRGSWSTFVRSVALYAHGPATQVSTRRSVADRSHDPRKRAMAKAALKNPPMRLNGEITQCVGKAIGGLGLMIHAIAIMPDPIHAVLGRGEVCVEQQVRRMKQAGTMALRDAGRVERERQVWVRSGLRRQRWSCVTAYAG